MSSVAESQPSTVGIEGELAYLLPTSEINRRYISPAGQLNFSEYESHTVFIRNARVGDDRGSFENHGFTLARFETELTAFKDSEQVERLYLPEAARFAQNLLAADLVLPIAWMVRCSVEGTPGSQPPANDVHVDYTPELSEWMPPVLLERANVHDFHYRRFVAINCWRPFTGAPQDWPLALCSARTVGPDEGATHGILHVDTLPDPANVPEILPDDNPLARSYDFSAFRFNPAHEWYYYPNMSTDEVVLFKNYDSARSGAWRVPHAGFKDPTCPATQPRESIEVRLGLFYR